MTFTTAELANEARREATFRRWVYSRQIAAGRLSAEQADRRIAMMDEIAARLQRDAVAEDPQGELL